MFALFSLFRNHFNGLEVGVVIFKNKTYRSGSVKAWGLCLTHDCIKVKGERVSAITIIHQQNWLSVIKCQNNVLNS